MATTIGIVHQHGAGGPYGLSFPDAPGCFSAADRSADLLDAAREALTLWCDDGGAAPLIGRDLAEIATDPAWAEAVASAALLIAVESPEALPSGLAGTVEDGGIEEPLKGGKTDHEGPSHLGNDDGPVSLWTPGQPLPVLCALDGVEVAIVAAASYRELVKTAAKVAFPGPSLREILPRRKARKVGSTIERDVEVAEFLRERFRTRMTLGQLRAACLERFGAERTPSLGRIGVFRQRAS